MITASAPGKIILFGEHAVVYGKPAIVAAINKRIYVTSQLTDSGIHIFSKGNTESSIDYVRHAIELIIGTERIKKQGIDIIIDSELPVGGGLGSSAALCIATIKSISTLFNINLDKEKIAKLGWETEFKVQSMSSGIDPFISTYGGAIYYKNGKFNYQKIDTSLSMILGYTGIPSSTKSMILKVSHLRERYPEIINPIINAIGNISERAKIIFDTSSQKFENYKSLIYKKSNSLNINDLGDLMNLNNNLLEALGVSSISLSELIDVSLLAGALGAKITGAGGGGCILAYTPKKEIEVLDAIKIAGGIPIPIEISFEGVRLEPNLKDRA